MRLSSLFSLLSLTVLALTSCGSPTPSTDGSSTAGDDFAVDKVLVDNSCLLVVGAYDRWAILDEESNRGNPGEVAARHFEEALDTVLFDAIDLYGYQDLIEAGKNAGEDKVGFSDEEVLAGIVYFRNALENDSTLQLSEVQPGKHVTFDTFFERTVKNRCELREGSEAAQEAAQAEEAIKTDISNRKSFSSYDEMIQAFVAGGGSCDVVIDELYCQSHGGDFQARLWLSDEPRTELPEPMDDMQIVFGQNWDLWINPELELDILSIVEAMQGEALP